MWNRIYYRSNSFLAIILYSQKSSLDKNIVRSTYPCITENLIFRRINFSPMACGKVRYRHYYYVIINTGQKKLRDKISTHLTQTFTALTRFILLITIYTNTVIWPNCIVTYLILWLKTGHSALIDICNEKKNHIILSYKSSASIDYPTIDSIVIVLIGSYTITHGTFHQGKLHLL